MQHLKLLAHLQASKQSSLIFSDFRKTHVQFTLIRNGKCSNVRLYKNCTVLNRLRKRILSRKWSSVLFKISVRDDFEPTRQPGLSGFNDHFQNLYLPNIFEQFSLLSTIVLIIASMRNTSIKSLICKKM